MQALAQLSPVTYALRGIRGALLDGASFGALWATIWPLLIMGAVFVPLGIWIFQRRRALRQADRPPEAERVNELRVTSYQLRVGDWIGAPS